MDRRDFLSSVGTVIATNYLSPLGEGLSVPAHSAGTETSGGDLPKIFWLSTPVGPGETVVVMGDQLGDHSVVEMAMAGAQKSTELVWHGLEMLQSSEQCLKALIPRTWSHGVYTCRVRRGGDISNSLLANAPTSWWWNGDSGSHATPGGWVRLFGKSLGKTGSSRVSLKAENGHEIELAAQGSDEYAVRFDVPAGLTAGAYELRVHNGRGGSIAWQNAGTLMVEQSTPWKQDVFRVPDFGTEPGAALLAAFAKARDNGGGVVYLPRGRYPVDGTLEIPQQTVIRGEAMGLVSLCWPDYDTPPVSLIHGADYGLESFSIYCQNHRDVVVASKESKRFFMNKVRIRANCYFGIENVGKDFRHRHGPKSNVECGATVLLQGTNFSVTDSDLYASNTAVRIRGAKVGVVANNRIEYASMAHAIDNTDRLVFEDNNIRGNHLLAMGNNISCFYSNYSRHVYYARNRIESVYGADRELMTLDAAGGAYLGGVAQTDGVRMVLSADPTYKDYASPSHTDWAGAAVQVLDGKGAGQYRFVTANNGRDWRIERPWDVTPDATSLIAIAPFRGQSLFIGNELIDGGPFQLYAAAHDSIVANNRGTRIDGLLVWGINPHGWGMQPSNFCQFLDNEILEGNGYGLRNARIGTLAHDEAGVFKGPLVRAAIFRRNICHNNSGFVLEGATADAVIEHCTIRDTDTAILISPTARRVLVRENTFERVGQGIMYSTSDVNQYQN